MIQDSGNLERIEHGLRFLPALTAAAKTDDLGLLRSLLDRHHHPHPAELGPALLQALIHGNEEAATILLDSGALTTDWEPLGTRAAYGQVLRDALENRNREIVYGLLDASHNIPRCLIYSSTRYYRDHPILEAAAAWGDESVLTALLTTFPSHT